MQESLFQVNTLSIQVHLVRSPHLKVYNFSEKTKSFYCPDGSTFYSKSKDLRIKTKSSCSSSCWSRADGCSASIFTTLMNKQFEVIITNLYSYEQKFNLTSIYINIHSEQIQLKIEFQVYHSNQTTILTTNKNTSYLQVNLCQKLFLIVILHRDLRNDLFFYLDFYSLFYLDFYSLFGLLYLFLTLISFFGLFFTFCTNRDLRLDFFQV